MSQKFSKMKKRGKKIISDYVFFLCVCVLITALDLNTLMEQHVRRDSVICHFMITGIQTVFDIDSNNEK